MVGVLLPLLRQSITITTIAKINNIGIHEPPLLLDCAGFAVFTAVEFVTGASMVCGLEGWRCLLSATCAAVCATAINCCCLLLSAICFSIAANCLVKLSAFLRFFSLLIWDCKSAACFSRLLVSFRCGKAVFCWGTAGAGTSCFWT